MSDMLGNRRLPDLRGHRPNGTGRLGAPMDAEESDRGEFVFDRCRACDGTGYCSRCKGDGRYLSGATNILVECSICGGSGACPICYGTGRLYAEAEDG